MKSPKRDYYEVLGVSRDADDQTIKYSYRKLAVRYHPDRNPGDGEAEERFKEAAEAYSVLSDAQKRAGYDRFGHQAEAPGFGGFDPSTFGDFSDILGDLFGLGDIFGRRGRGGRGSVGADLRYDLELSFEEAAFGCETTLRIPRLERCESCGGSGGDADTCSACRGQGQVRFSQGFFTVARACPQCGGRGRVITDPCGDCGGQGRIEQERSLEVTIPAGVDTGARLRLRGEGEHGQGAGPPGDLYVVIQVADHEHFERRGADVFSRVDMSYPQAVIGASFEVETLHGSEILEIPAGTQPGAEFRLRGKGIERLDRSGRGDHYFFARLTVPKVRDLEEESIELLRRMAELEGSEVRDEGVMDKVKKLFH